MFWSVLAALAVHGVVKEVWRAMRYDPRDPTRPTLA